MSRPHIPRGLQLAVMCAVTALGPRAWGVEIHTHIGADKFRISNVYLAIKRLKARGLLKTRPLSADGSGYPRQLCELTASGRKALDAALDMLRLPSVYRPETVTPGGPGMLNEVEKKNIADLVTTYSVGSVLDTLAGIAQRNGDKKASTSIRKLAAEIA